MRGFQATLALAALSMASAKLVRVDDDEPKPEPAPEIDDPQFDPRPLTRQQRRYQARKGR